MAELKKTLGYPTIIALSLTSLMGTGFFFGAKIGAEISGTLSIFAWILMAILSIYIASCFGELVSMYPTAGGVYEYSKKAYGRFSSFMIGWLTWIVYNISTSVLIVAAIEYVMPKEAMALKMVICILLILTLNYITLRGVEISSVVMIIFAIITLTLLLSIILPGLGLINLHYFSSDIISSSPLRTLPLIFLTLFFIVESFFGWESVTFMAEETKNPERIIPRSLMIVTIITVVLSVLIAIVTLGIIPLQTLRFIPLPLNYLEALFYGSNSLIILNIGIFVTLIGSAASGIVSSPRLLLALARDKLFIEQLADIHPKYKTPYKAIIFQTIISIIVVFIAFGKYESLLSLLVPLALIMYITVLLSLTILRYKKPELPRTFKAPLGKILPVIISIFFVIVIILWVINTPNAIQLFRIAISFILFGIPIYLLLTFYYNPDAVIKATNFFSYFNLFLEDFFLPKSIRRQMVNLFRDMNKKTILEFGSGVGSLTMHLAEAVGREGIVFATELSKKNTEILEARLRKKGHFHVQVIHDEHQVNRVHPSIKHADMIFSVGMLSYMQDVDKILKEMNNLLPEQGKICFLEYIDYFKLLPNPKWLSDNKTIEEAFRRNGFSVRVKRVRSLFWNYLLVYGMKTKYNIPVI